MFATFGPSAFDPGYRYSGMMPTQLSRDFLNFPDHQSRTGRHGVEGLTDLMASRVSEIQKTWDFWISPGPNSPKSLFSGSESQKLLDFFLSLATKSVIYQFRQIPAPKSPQIPYTKPATEKTFNLDKKHKFLAFLF